MFSTLVGSVLLAFLGVGSLVYGNESQNQEILDKICERAQASIERIEREKVFLRSDSLWLYHDQMFVIGEYGDLICLPILSYEDKGFYLIKDHRNTIYICSSCTKAYYNYKPDKCEVCWGTNFIVRFQ